MEEGTDTPRWDPGNLVLRMPPPAPVPLPVAMPPQAACSTASHAAPVTHPWRTAGQSAPTRMGCRYTPTHYRRAQPAVEFPATTPGRSAACRSRFPGLMAGFRRRPQRQTVRRTSPLRRVEPVDHSRHPRFTLGRCALREQIQAYRLRNSRGWKQRPGLTPAAL